MKGGFLANEPRPLGNERSIDEQFDWLLQGLNDDSGSGEIADHLQQYVVADHSLLINRIVNAIRRGKCPAISKSQFVRWCKRQIEQQADSLLPFFLATRIKEANGRLSLADVFNIARVHGRIRKGTQLFPRTIINGDIALIDVGSGVLKVPAKADSDNPEENFLPILELLWPWAVRAGRVEKHVSRQSFSTGRVIPSRLPLHRLFLDFAHGNCADSPIETKNGDFLDWTANNLVRKGAEGSIPWNLIVPVKQGRDGDLWPLHALAAQDPVTGAPISPLPARASKPKGSSPDADDNDVDAYCRSETLHPARGAVLKEN